MKSRNLSTPFLEKSHFWMTFKLSSVGYSCIWLFLSALPHRLPALGTDVMPQLLIPIGRDVFHLGSARGAGHRSSISTGYSASTNFFFVIYSLVLNPFASIKWTLPSLSKVTKSTT